MLRFDINGNSNAIRSLSVISFAVGLFLISFPSFIGLTMIRVVGILLAVFSGFGIHFTEGTIWGRDRSFFFVGVLIGVLVMIFPTLIMIVSGLGLLSFAVYKLFFIFRERGALDKNEFIMSAVSLILGLVLMFYGRAAIETIVRIIGVFVISFSAVLFYKTLES